MSRLQPTECSSESVGAGGSCLGADLAWHAAGMTAEHCTELCSASAKACAECFPHAHPTQAVQRLPQPSVGTGHQHACMYAAARHLTCGQAACSCHSSSRNRTQFRACSTPRNMTPKAASSTWPGVDQHEDAGVGGIGSQRPPPLVGQEGDVALLGWRDPGRVLQHVAAGLGLGRLWLAGAGLRLVHLHVCAAQ